MRHSPEQLDRRSLELHRLIAQRLQAQPALLEQARSNIHRWRQSDPRGCAGWDEWESILAGGLNRAVQAMLDPTDRGQYLRSCTPFTRVLAPSERADFLRRWNARN